jgi:hypothetical protein
LIIPHSLTSDIPRIDHRIGQSSCPARDSPATLTRTSTTNTAARLKVSNIDAPTMPCPSAAHSSDTPLDPTAPSWAVPQHVLDRMARLSICVQGNLDTPASETGRPADDESALPMPAAAVPAGVPAQPSSTSRAPPTPPDSDSEDVDDLISSAYAQPAICNASPTPIVTIDKSQPDHLHHIPFPCGTIIWAKLRRKGRYWVVIQSYFYHCVVLPIFTFHRKGLQGALRLAEAEYISIKDPGTRRFENQRPRVEPLVTAGTIKKGLHAKSIVQPLSI